MIISSLGSYIGQDESERGREKARGEGEIRKKKQSKLVTGYIFEKATICLEEYDAKVWPIFIFNLSYV